jgi:hypothetical protein
MPAQSTGFPTQGRKACSFAGEFTCMVLIVAAASSSGRAADGADAQAANAKAVRCYVRFGCGP